ncbi:17796_t:CDS:2, partial [Cetraspora pellucida]
HYRNSLNPGGQLKISPEPGITKVCDIWQSSLKKFKNRECLGFRKFDEETGSYGNYVWQTYEQVNERIINFGNGLLHLQINIIKSDQTEKFKIGICSINRPE